MENPSSKIVVSAVSYAVRYCEKTLLLIGVGRAHCTSSSDWLRTGRAHGAAIGDVLTGTLGTGVFELARKLLELVALPFLKSPVTNREAAAVACGITPKGITQVCGRPVQDDSETVGPSSPVKTSGD